MFVCERNNRAHHIRPEGSVSPTKDLRMHLASGKMIETKNRFMVSPDFLSLTQ